MQWGELSDIAKIIIQVGAVIGAITVLVKAGRRPYVWAVNLCKEVKFMFRQREIHASIDEKLDVILGELKPNGGDSIKDAINRIERRQDFFGSFRRTQLNTSSTPMVETDDVGRVIWVNRAFSKMVGKPEKDLLGSGWVNIIAPRDRARAEHNWVHTVEERRMMDEPQTFVRDDGSEYQVRTVAHPILAEDGTFFGHLAEVNPIELRPA